MGTKKTVLVVSQDSVNRRLYQDGLSKHFEIEFTPGKEVDAVIVDIAGMHGSIDLRWLTELDLPTVVLTPEDSLPLPKAANRCILTYPVSMDRLLKALIRLGVKAEPPKPRL